MEPVEFEVLLWILVSRTRRLYHVAKCFDNPKLNESVLMVVNRTARMAHELVPEGCPIKFEDEALPRAFATHELFALVLCGVLDAFRDMQLCCAANSVSVSTFTMVIETSVLFFQEFPQVIDESFGAHLRGSTDLEEQSKIPLVPKMCDVRWMNEFGKKMALAVIVSKSR